jgi:myo-inositol-1(or 4)-monophosphatase
LPAHEADVALLIATVRAAGAVARGFVTGGNKSWRKDNGTPVSEGDLAVNAFLKERLRAARPDYGWLSEESEDDAARLTARRVFVVDPIDGTAAFLRGLPDFTVSVAVVEDHAPVSGAVYNPLLDECYSARKGGGAFRNGASIHASTRADLEGCRILVRKSLLRAPHWEQFPWPAMHVEDRYSAAYRLALVASGAFDATVSMTSKCDWDLAAADLIVREAGGIASLHDGSVARYNLVNTTKPSAVAAGPALHPAVIARTRLVDVATVERDDP